jgi:hypothetical protein
MAAEHHRDADLSLMLTIWWVWSRIFAEFIGTECFDDGLYRLSGHIPVFSHLTPQNPTRLFQ